MRTIKYRAWVKRYEIIGHPSGLQKTIWNKMVPVTGLHFFEGQELWEISIDTEEVGEIQNILLEDHGTSIELMQYTGLKDSNCKGIYEGDIVQAPSDFGITHYYKVITSYLCFSLEQLDGKHKGNLEVFLNTWKKCEVIGNIHENPELLKED